MAETKEATEVKFAETKTRATATTSQGRKSVIVTAISKNKMTIETVDGTALGSIFGLLPLEGVCPMCGKLFKKSRANQIYDSIRCKNLHNVRKFRNKL